MLWLIISYTILGGFLFGYDLGCINGALPKLLQDNVTFSEGLTDTEAEAIVGITKVGAAVGAFVAIFTVRHSHRLTFFMSGLNYVVGPVLLALGSSFVIIMVGRFLTGLAIGLAAVGSPTYLGEVAPAAHRGCVVGLYELAVAIGVLFAAIATVLFNAPWVDSAIAPFIPPVQSWRVLLGLPAIPAIPFFLGCLVLSETPSRLVELGRRNEAFAMLVTLNGGTPRWRGDLTRAAVAASSGQLPPPSSAPQLTQPADRGRSPRSTPGSRSVLSRSEGDSHDGERVLTRITGASSHGSFHDMPLSGSHEDLEPTSSEVKETRAHVGARATFDALIAEHERASTRGGAHRPAYRLLLTRERYATVLMLLLSLCNQGNGSSTLLYYWSEMCQSAQLGMGAQEAAWVSTVACLLKMLCVFLSVLMVDRCGRRPLLLLGALLTSASLGLAAYASIPGATSRVTVILGLLGFVGAYAISLAPIFYTLVAELFAPATRPLAAGMATATTFAAGAACDHTYLSMRDAIGYHGVFIVYAGVCAFGGLAVWALLPETKGKTLAEVQGLIAAQTCSGCMVGSASGSTMREPLDEEGEADARLASKMSSGMLIAT